jgi:hypothetical protein
MPVLSTTRLLPYELSRMVCLELGFKDITLLASANESMTPVVDDVLQNQLRSILSKYMEKADIDEFLTILHHSKGGITHELALQFLLYADLHDAFDGASLTVVIPYPTNFFSSFMNFFKKVGYEDFAIKRTPSTAFDAEPQLVVNEAFGVRKAAQVC